MTASKNSKEVYWAPPHIRSKNNINITTVLPTLSKRRTITLSFNNIMPTKQEMTATEQNDLMSRERAFLTKMFEAAWNGEGAKVKQLVEDYSTKHNIPPSEVLSQFQDGQGRTALHFASHSNPENSSSNTEDIMSLLLHWLPKENSINLVKIKDKEGMTPLMLAASNKNGTLAEQRVDTILTIGGDKLSLARSKAGATALHYAAAAADTTTPATILRLYNAGKVALETNSLKGGTPLHWAAADSPPTNHSVVLNTLLQECGANVNAKNEQGMPCLIMAAAARNDVHCNLLVEAGADISTELPGNINIFHMAADLNLVGTLAALVDMHDKATIQEYCGKKTATGETPLDVALLEGNLGCVMLLSGEQEEATAQAMIDEAKKNAPPRESSAATATPQVEPLPQTEGTDKDEVEAMEVLAKIAGMAISDDDIKRSMELKQQGNQHFANKEWQQSLDYYSRAIELNPADATFYSNRSACCMELGRPEEALKDAVIARKLKPEWSKACYRMAVARLELGRYEDAAVAAFEGLQQDEDNVELRQLLKESVEKGRKEHEAKQKAEQETKQSDGSRKKVLVANLGSSVP